VETTPDQLLERVYNSAGGLLRFMLETEEQEIAYDLAIHGKLIFHPAAYELGNSYDGWALPYDTNIEELRDEAGVHNDDVNRAVLWNDNDELEDDEWLGQQEGGEAEWEEDGY